MFKIKNHPFGFVQRGGYSPVSPSARHPQVVGCFLQLAWFSFPHLWKKFALLLLDISSGSCKSSADY